MLGACAALLGATSATPVAAASGQVDGLAIQAPASQIEITRVFAYTIVIYADRGAGSLTSNYWNAGCVNYVNAGPKVISHIQFMFALRLSDGTMQKPAPLDVGGRFLPGVPQGTTTYREFPDSFTPYFDRDCRTVDGTISGGQIFLKRTPGELLSWVNTVTYADGSTWRAPPQAERTGASASR